MSQEYSVDLFKEIAFDLKIFARLNGMELDEEVILNLDKAEFPDSLVISLKDKEDMNEILKMATKSLKELSDAYKNNNTNLIDLAAAEFAAIYLNKKYDVSPDESVWLDEGGLVRQASMINIQEIYSKYNLKSANWQNISEDNLSLQLEFLAHLIENGKNPENLIEVAEFMDSHLLIWLKDFAVAIFNRCESEFYASMLILTYVYCDSLRDILAEILDKPKKILSVDEAVHKLSKSNKKC